MIDAIKLKETAQGRWISIFRGLGISVPEDGKHGPCPVCGGKDRFRLDRDSADRGTWYCGGCDPHAGDGLALVQGVMGVDFKEAMEAVSSIVGGCEKHAIPKETRITSEQLRKFFTNSCKITCEDVAGKYLLGRGLTVTPPNALWNCPDCWEAEEQNKVNALLGVFQMPDGTAVSIHRTFLNTDSEKLGISQPKKMTPTLVDNISGGAVRLFPEQGDTLCIAEGIETAIAAHEDMGFPSWAATTSTLLESFVPPAWAKHIIVIGDNDINFAGQKSAYLLANRIVIKYKRKCSVYVPSRTNEDWLDVLLRQKGLTS